MVGCELQKERNLRQLISYLQNVKVPFFYSSFVFGLGYGEKPRPFLLCLEYVIKHNHTLDTGGILPIEMRLLYTPAEYAGMHNNN